MCYSIFYRKELSELADDYLAKLVRSPAAPDGSELPHRVFPGTVAPVIHAWNGRHVLSLMRYGIGPRKTFNARRDNLTAPFWRQAFGKHHGIVVLNGFYEWVTVKDLLKSRLVTLKQVKDEFAQQAEQRRKRIEAQGKPYKPTPTERKDPRFRQIVVEFAAETASDLIAPVLFTESGFAIVTDDPLPRVRAAGHDRSPVLLDPAVLDEWLNPLGKEPEALDRILGHKQRVPFHTGLAA